jgi:hypothetical protein
MATWRTFLPSSFPPRVRTILQLSNPALPEFQSLPRVWFLGKEAESFYLALGTGQTLGKQASLPRAKQKALGTEKTLAKDFFTKSQLAGSRQRISLPSAIF